MFLEFSACCRRMLDIEEAWGRNWGKGKLRVWSASCRNWGTLSLDKPLFGTPLGFYCCRQAALRYYFAFKFYCSNCKLNWNDRQLSFKKVFSIRQVFRAELLISTHLPSESMWIATRSLWVLDKPLSPGDLDRLSVDWQSIPRLLLYILHFLHYHVASVCFEGCSRTSKTILSHFYIEVMKLRKCVCFWQSAIKVLTSLLEVVPAYLDALGNLGVAYLHR